MERVATIVVTYNRLIILKEVIESLRNQTYKNNSIIVVNNSSTDGTLEWLSEQNDLKVITQENCGGAGGFHTGMKYAAENSFDYCWIMDDDVVTTPTALEELITGIHKKDNIGYVCSLVKGIDGRPMNTPSVDIRGKDGYYPDFCDLIQHQMIKVTEATFVSVLIPCRIVCELGLPYKEFFIWGDDSEYTLRLSSKYDCYMVCKSIVVHKRTIQKQLTIEEENDKKRLKNHFYNIRNTGYYTSLYGTLQEKVVYHLWIYLMIIRNLFSRMPYKSWVVLKGYLAYFVFKPHLMYPKK